MELFTSSGPFAPNHKEPTELTEPEIKRLKETAKTFGYGKNETLDRFVVTLPFYPPNTHHFQGQLGEDKQGYGGLQETLCGSPDCQHHRERSGAILLFLRKC